LRENLILFSCFFQLLPRGRGRAPGVRHRQAPHLRERGAVAEGAQGPRRLEHRHHARRKQGKNYEKILHEWTCCFAAAFNAQVSRNGVDSLAKFAC
jgi:hypothetical protein